MKKITLSCLMLAGLLLGSCSSKSDPEADAQKMCDMIERSHTLKAEGKEEDVIRLLKEVQSFGQQLEEKYKNDQKARNLIKEKVDGCMNSQH